jgi:hypothetical protein
MQLLRSLGEAERVGDRYEITEVTKLHDSTAIIGRRALGKQTKIPGMRITRFERAISRVI